jgi:NADP-dependent 3-hydroxy acid dehydrogenase YdfG
MAKQLASKVAIVTGASRGISVALAQEAATVVLAARSIQKLQETADQVTQAGKFGHLDARIK